MANPAPRPVGGDNGGNENPQNLSSGLEFDPTDAELIGFLKNRILGRHGIFPDIIPTTDVFGTNPDQLPFDRFMFGNGKRWIFYAIKAQNNLYNGDGYWSPKSEVDIHVRDTVVGFRKEFIYYRGMEREGKRTDWCMHRYNVNPSLYAANAVSVHITHLIVNLVICKIFRNDTNTRSKRGKRIKKS